MYSFTLIPKNTPLYPPFPSYLYNQMKQFIAISLFCLYTLSSLGMGVKQFYCCGKLKSTSISFYKEKQCGMSKKMPGCCKTIFKKFQVKEHNSTFAEYISSFHQDGCLPTETWKENNVNTLIDTPLQIHQANAPPDQLPVPLYILYCSYRI